MFGKQKNNHPWFFLLIFQWSCRIFTGYSHLPLVLGLQRQRFDVDVYGHRLMPWKKVVRTFVRQPLCLQMLLRCPKPCSSFRWSLESFLRGLRFDMLMQVEGWGLTRCIMRSDCSCKVAAWGSWGTSLWSGEIVKLSLMLQVQVPVSWNRTT